jgi:DNA-binding NarL/FixJ family response regulator
MLHDHGFSDPQKLGRALIAWNHQLSQDEVRLLELIAQGLTQGQIAAKLAIVREKTVKSRIRRLYLKLGVAGQVEAAVIAALHRLVPAKGAQPRAN